MTYRSKEQILLSEDRSSLSMRQTEFNSKQYSTWEYPIGELGTERYPHFTLFYINANSRSQILKANKGSMDVHDDVDLTLKGSGTASSKIAKKTELGEQASKIVGGVVSTKRIVHAICLPMPLKVQANYAADYTKTEEVGMIGATLFAAASGQGMQSAEFFANTLAQTAIPGAISGTMKIGQIVSGSMAANKLGKKFSAETAKSLGQFVSGAKIDNPKLLEQISSKLVGAVINKRQEQLFQSMEFRAHNFQWLFLPRSKEESEVIFNIIKLFKENMHPELDKDTGNSMLIMPSEFDVEFRYGNEENLRISRVATCVLKSCSVDYTAVGEFISFAGYKDPIAISLNLIFQEMEPLDRSLISNYF